MDQPLIKSYLANVLLDVSIAARTRVTSSWRELDFVPPFNRCYFILDGEGFVKIKDKELYPKAGQMVIMPAGVEQSYSVTDPERLYDKYWCHFTATTGGLNLFQVVSLPCCVDVGDIAGTKRLFEVMIEHYRRGGPADMLRTKAVLMELLCRYIEYAGPENLKLSPSASIGKLQTVLGYIGQHLSEEISVDELARLIHFHPSYFSRYFKSMLGLSPVQYIQKVKLDKAKDLLTHTDKGVAEIAEEIGMQQHYFSRLFRSYSGYAPTEFRKAVQRGIAPAEEQA